MRRQASPPIPYARRIICNDNHGNNVVRKYINEAFHIENEQIVQLNPHAFDFSTQDRFVYRHQWRVGDVLVWDNRCTLHTGTLYDDTKYDRLMHRLWAKGDKVIGVPQSASQGNP